MPAGKQTETVNILRAITGWTVKKATDFVKSGDYPKVVLYNANTSVQYNVGGKMMNLSGIITNWKNGHNIIFEIY